MTRPAPGEVSQCGGNVVHSSGVKVLPQRTEGQQEVGVAST